MNYWTMIYCGLLGMGIVLLGVPLVLKAAQVVKLPLRRQDLHHTQQPPVPRWGGLALVAAFVGVELLMAACEWGVNGGLVRNRVVIISSLAMFGLGFWDDIRPLGARRKLLGQILIAAAVCFCGIGIEQFGIPFTGRVIDLHGWGVLITVFWLVGMTNLINLIDGVDGLAGGICLMLMALLAYVGHQSGAVGLVASGMAGALLAFLWFNFPPARIYLGDGGAYFLGFQIGLLALLSSQKGTVFVALVAPLFVLALPILDVMLAILRRGLRGLPVFRPDRKHIHHHLLDMGLSRRKVVLWLYAVTLVFLVMGIAAYASRGQLIPLLVGLAIIILLICAGKLRFSREWFAVGRMVGNSLGMRQEVEYALAMTRCLALEGKRCGSVEELWSHLAFAGQRLGFSYIRLTLADGHRVWEQDHSCEPRHSVRRELQGGRLGILELKAPTCDLDHAASGVVALRRPDCRRSFCPCVSEGRVFEIISDLLAEGWVKAAMTWEEGEQTPLRFDASVLLPGSQGQRSGLGC
jgi:UDP-GlcNAc:undecaprenyl-phosphate/decaprenyl-phosphate GlcNAc-1-phosphate transferase